MLGGTWLTQFERIASPKNCLGGQVRKVPAKGKGQGLRTVPPRHCSGGVYTGAGKDCSSGANTLGPVPQILNKETSTAAMPGNAMGKWLCWTSGAIFVLEHALCRHIFFSRAMDDGSVVR
jgi:hypothetical protein